MLFSFFIVVISLFLCIKSLNHEFIKGNIRHKHDQSMAIYIAILCLVPISEVLRHIVVWCHCGEFWNKISLVSHWWYKTFLKYFVLILLVYLEVSVY